MNDEDHGLRVTRLAIKYGLIYVGLLLFYYALQAAGKTALAEVFSEFLLAPLAIGLAFRVGGLVIEKKATSVGGEQLTNFYIRARNEGALILKSVAAPSAFLYFFLKATVGYSALSLSPRGVDYLAEGIAAIFIASVGGFIWRAGEIRGPERAGSSIYSKSGEAFALYGVGSLFMLYSPYVGVPLIVVAAVAGAFALGLSLLLILGVRWPHATQRAFGEAEATYWKALVVFFVLGIFYALLGATSNPQYSRAAWLAIIAIMFVAAFTFFFRSYSAMAQISGAISERVYEQHSKEVKEFLSGEDEDYVRMVKIFLAKGDKDELLVFAAYRLTLCGSHYPDVVRALEPLMEYKKPVYGAIWPWEEGEARRNAEEDARLRKGLLNDLIEKINACGKKGLAQSNGHKNDHKPEA